MRPEHRCLYLTRRDPDALCVWGYGSCAGKELYLSHGSSAAVTLLGRTTCERHTSDNLPLSRTRPFFWRQIHDQWEAGGLPFKCGFKSHPIRCRPIESRPIKIHHIC